MSISSSPDGAVRIAELALHVRRSGGRLSVADMADLTGLSREHLRRLFLEYVGVGPNLYARGRPFHPFNAVDGGQRPQE